MMYGLEAEDIELINAVFKRFPTIEKAILYGFRATGKYRYNSDIDLTLTGPSLTLTELFEIEHALEDLFLPYKIDLSIYHTIGNKDLRQQIDQEGRDFYSR